MQLIISTLNECSGTYAKTALDIFYERFPINIDKDRNTVAIVLPSSNGDNLSTITALCDLLSTNKTAVIMIKIDSGLRNGMNVEYAFDRNLTKHLYTRIKYIGNVIMYGMLNPGQVY